jgi:hypothetical protein
MNVENVGAYLKGVFGGGVSLTAGGAGDGAEVSGPYVDRLGYRSCEVMLAWTATLADTESLTLASNLQDASDSSGTGVADYGSATSGAAGGSEILASTAVATSSGGSTETGVTSYNVNLTMADRYLRCQFTPTMSASGTDTAVVSAVIVLGGGDLNPAV